MKTGIENARCTVTVDNDVVKGKGLSYQEAGSLVQELLASGVDTIRMDVLMRPTETIPRVDISPMLESLV